jgi:phosphatidylglycerophosphate synthase
VESVEGALPADSILILRADYLFDQRALEALVQDRFVLAVTENGGKTPVGASVSRELASTVARYLRREQGADLPTEIPVKTPEDLGTRYVQELRKLEPPVVLAIRPEGARQLERYLFDGAYKGVTDLITKWIWPTPARWVTGICARRSIRPNQITAFGLTLVVLVTLLFWFGWRGTGLVLAWVMTFLDTVDGKLARVTVQSSRLGHFLDHVVDIIHPPFWYLAWGFGLGSWDVQLLGLEPVLVLIVGAYVVGRLVEGVFTLTLGSFGIFCWRPIDSYFRLIMARRNPNLLLLTAGALMIRPSWGLLVVCAWTVFCAVFLLVRLLMGVWARLMSGPLSSWLVTIAADNRVSRLSRPFVQQGALGKASTG